MSETKKISAKLRTGQFYDNGVVILEKVLETISYCTCGQAVRFCKKDGKYTHIGWKRQFERYSEFLKRTDHAVFVKDIKKWESWEVVGNSEHLEEDEEEIEETREKDYETLKTEIAQLEKGLEGIAKRREAKHKEIENSEEYKALKVKYAELDKKVDSLYKQTQKRNIEIASEFVEQSNEHLYVSPSWSKTYDENIHSNVILAIKKTFDWKKLSGSAIEGIVTKLINGRRAEDETIKKLNESTSEASFERGNVGGEQQKLMTPEKDIDSEHYQCLQKIDELKKELARFLLHKEDSSSKEIKEATELGSYTKKQVLEEYREQCILQSKKVLENLNTSQT